MTARKAGIALSLADGTDLADKINPRLVSLSLTERREAKADELDVRLQNADGLLQIPHTGAVLSLSLGWTSGDGVPLGLVAKGTFTVDEVGQEGPPDIVTFRARSADLTGKLRQRRTTSWNKTTLGAILQAIGAARDHCTDRRRSFRSGDRDDRAGGKKRCRLRRGSRATVRCRRHVEGWQAALPPDR